MKRKQPKTRLSIYKNTPLTISLSNSAKPKSLGNGVYEKELAYQGVFYPSGKYKLDLSNNLLRHWRDSFNAFTRNGNQVPVYVGHVDVNDKSAPLKRRGTLLGVSLRKNSKGKLSLYGKIKLSRDSDVLSLSQVSLFSPSIWRDGKGKSYERPITHVAITDTPVIPGLEPFQSISLSLESDVNSISNTTVRKVNKMNKEELAAMYGLDIATLDKLIEDLSAFLGTAVPPEPVAELNALLSETGGEISPEVFEEIGMTPEASTQLADLEEQKDQLSAEISQVDQQITEILMDEEKTDMSLSNNPRFISMVVDARRTKIDGLLRDRKITPPQRKRLLEMFCNSRTASRKDITLSYDQTISVLKMQSPVVPRGGSVTGPQGTGMSARDVFAAARGVLRDNKKF